MLGEVSEKVSFIQDSLSDLDGQLGQLQELSAQAVDTLSLLSASDSRYQEEARLAQCRPIAASHRILPHSWTFPHRSEGVLNVRRVMAKSCKSTPPSLLKGYTLVGSRRASQEVHAAPRGGRGERQGHTEEGEEGAQEVLYRYLYRCQNLNATITFISVLLRDGSTSLTKYTTHVLIPHYGIMCHIGHYVIK